MKAVDRPPDNPKRITIESSQEVFSVDISRTVTDLETQNTTSQQPKDATSTLTGQQIVWSAGIHISTKRSSGRGNKPQDEILLCRTLQHFIIYYFCNRMSTIDIKDTLFMQIIVCSMLANIFIHFIPTTEPFFYVTMVT